MARLFVAVWPPPEVVEELVALRRKDQRGVRFVPPENWHVTLRFLGDADPDEVIAALDDASLPAADARVGPGVDVFADRALVVPVHGLDDLATAVRDVTASIGQPLRRRFAGHLTLARLKPHAELPSAMGAYVEATFAVTEIALVESRLDPAGARYATLATWPTFDPQ